MFNWRDLLNPIREHNMDYKEDDNTRYSSNDNRSPFQKDFDTICNSSSMRRLQAKAQVFPLERGDFSRTRLTHSIETMSIAESIGYSIIKIINKKESLDNATKELVNDIPMILKSAALIHDIGNPPFGHISEGIISKWFRDNLQRLYFENDKLNLDDRAHDIMNGLNGILTEEQMSDLTNFDGNAQALRTITHLQNPITYKGMNLTYPVMATIIKYPTIPGTNKDVYGIPQNKKAYFLEEESVYIDIENRLKLNYRRHPLVYLLEASDDIAYLTADLEDACRKGLISINDIKEELKKQYEDAVKDQSIANEDIDILEYAINCLLDYENRLKSTQKNINDIDIVVMRQFRAQIKGKMISEVIKSFDKNYQQIMSGLYKNELLKESNIILLRNVFSDLLRKKVYYSQDIIKSKIESCKIISNLLSNYILSIFNYNADTNGLSDDEASLIYNTLSEDYRAVCKHSINKFTSITQNDGNLTNREKNDRIRQKTAYYKLLLVIDNISGMTDTYAYDIYHMINAI